MTISRFFSYNKDLHTSANLSLEPPELTRQVTVHFSAKFHTIRTGSSPFNMLHHVGLLLTTFWPPVSFPIPCNSEHHTTSPINPPPTNPFKHSLMPSLLHISQQANPNWFPSSLMSTSSPSFPSPRKPKRIFKKNCKRRTQAFARGEETWNPWGRFSSISSLVYGRSG
jgi:hypothetical protein